MVSELKLTDALLSTLDKMVSDYLPDLKWLKDEPMSRHTSFRIGGPAKRMAVPGKREQIVLLLGFLEELGLFPILLGNGTNLLVADQGLDAVVIKTGELSELRLEGDDVVVADAGVSLARLGMFAWKNGLTGVEFAHGIPGSLGGGVVMNAGAYGGELKDVITEVTAVFPDGVKTLRGEELGFSYRHSIFSECSEAVVLGAKLKLARGDAAQIKARMDELAAKRKASQPLEFPSAGSTFKRPAGHFAGALIETNGLKGKRIGGAEVSQKHAGFIINVENATCADVLSLIEHVQKTVFDASGVMLEPEVKIIG